MCLSLLLTPVSRSFLVKSLSEEENIVIWVSTCLVVLGSLPDLIVLPALYDPWGNLVTCYYCFGIWFGYLFI